jgi:hypothetical protein
MSRTITIDKAHRIAKRHGYRDGKPMRFLDMMQIVCDAYAAGYEKAKSEQLSFCDSTKI